MIILDTNVISEVLKPRPSPIVMRWLAEHEPQSMYVTTITQAETLFGIALLPDGKRRKALADAIEGIFAEDFEGRMLPFDDNAARMFATIAARRSSKGRPISQFDAMIAAIARSHDAVLATRNTADFEDCGVTLANPWSAA